MDTGRIVCGLLIVIANTAILVGIVYGIVRLCKGIYRLLDKLIDKL